MSGSDEDKIFERCVASLPPLAGKCIAVTGTTSGTGYYACTAALRKRPAALLLLNRASSRSEASAEKLKQIASGTVVQTVNCDLMSFSSVKQAATELSQIVSKYGGLDVLACNAGVMGLPDQRTEDGLDVQMQTNHLSHFLLVNLLLPSLEAGAAARGEARVVMHSSGARNKHMARDKVGMLQEQYFRACPPGSLGGDQMGACFDRYHQTKLSNSVLTMALHAKLQTRGSCVKSICAEPGVAKTDLASNLAQGHTKAGGQLGGFADTQVTMYPGIQSAADGACPLIFASFAADVGFRGLFHARRVCQQGKCRGVASQMRDGCSRNPNSQVDGEIF